MKRSNGSRGWAVSSAEKATASPARSLCGAAYNVSTISPSEAQSLINCTTLWVMLRLPRVPLFRIPVRILVLEIGGKIVGRAEAAEARPPESLQLENGAQTVQE